MASENTITIIVFSKKQYDTNLIVVQVCYFDETT